MNLLFISGFLFLNVWLLQTWEYSDVRSLFIEAGVNRNMLDKFVDYVNEQELEDNFLMLAYKGTAYTMKADNISGVYNKLQIFNKGKEMLENAVMNDPHNTEIRYLRFQVQENAPAFLSYNNIEEDRQYIIDHLQDLLSISDTRFVNIVIRSIIESESITDKEMTIVKAKISGSTKTTL